MLFTSVPDNLSSLCSPLRYTFADEGEPRDLAVEILDVDSGELLFTKRLYQTASGEVDIAPLLRRHLKFDPSAISEGLVRADGRYFRIRVQVEDAQVDRTFLPFENPFTGVLLTSMPKRRLLARGEKEELFLRPGVSSISLRYQTATGSSARLFTATEASRPARFGILTENMPEGTQRIEVTISSSLVGIQTLHYTIIEPPMEGLRLAWVGRRGSIEHYTFPCCERQSEEQTRNEVTLQGGESRLVGATAQRRWVVTSAYEQPEVLEALAEIGTAPQIWYLDAKGEYCPISVLPASRQTLRHGMLNALQFTLCSTVKQLSLWS